MTPDFQIGDYVMHHPTCHVGRVVCVTGTLSGRHTYDIEDGPRGLHPQEMDTIVGVVYEPDPVVRNMEGDILPTHHRPYLITDSNERIQPRSIAILREIEAWLTRRNQKKTEQTRQ